MTKDMRYMSYDELTEYASEVLEELRRKAYAEGYEDGKNVERMTLARKLADDLLKETPQQARDRIVEQAKYDIDRFKGKGAYKNEYTFDGWRANAEFVLNKEKRTVVAILRTPIKSQVVSRGIAKCAPGDCFNVHIGKAIALRRALGLEVPAEYLNAPQPTEVRVGDEIYDEYYQMSGKVYAIDPEYRTYGEDAGYYFGKSKGWLTYIDPRNFERRIERKFVKVTDDSREVSE